MTFLGGIEIDTKEMRSMVSYLSHKKDADIIFIDTQEWNKRAIRCYEKKWIYSKSSYKVQRNA